MVDLPALLAKNIEQLRIENMAVLIHD